MNIFSAYSSRLPRRAVFVVTISIGLAAGLMGCSSVPDVLNPSNIYGDVFQNKSSRSDVLEADVENRAHSDFILRGGALSRLPSLQTNEGITPQPSEPVETKPLSDALSEPVAESAEKNLSFPGLSGVVQ